MNQYTDPTQHFFWLSSRALGIVAIVLLAGSVFLGLTMSARIARKPGATGRLKNLHEALALTATAAIAGHGLTLLGDSYLHPGLVGISLPFVMHNQPIWTGIGIIGGWLAAIFTLSYYVRRWIGTKAWRWLHRWTIGAYALAMVHVIGSGTDTSTPWMMALLVAINVPVVFALAARVLPRSPSGQSTQSPAPRQRPAVTATNDRTRLPQRSPEAIRP